MLPSGCGHWGLLVVDVNAQGTGVASALVRTAEARLASLGCRQVQIEYSYTCGDAESERLRAWYEGPLNFSGGGSPTTVPGRSEFRRLRKALAKASTEKQRANGASDDQAETAVGFSGCFGYQEAYEQRRVDKHPSAECCHHLLLFLRLCCFCKG